MQESDCTKEPEVGCFRMLVDYQREGPREALQHLPKSLIQAPGATEEHSHGSPQFAHLVSPEFKNILGFALFECPKIPTKHQSTPKNVLLLPLFSLFQPLLPLFEVLP